MSPTTTVMGQPNGARLLSRTCVPGIHPISNSFRAISGSFRQQMVPLSPSWRSVTLRGAAGDGVRVERFDTGGVI